MKPRFAPDRNDHESTPSMRESTPKRRIPQCSRVYRNPKPAGQPRVDRRGWCDQPVRAAHDELATRRQPGRQRQSRGAKRDLIGTSQRGLNGEAPANGGFRRWAILGSKTRPEGARGSAPRFLSPRSSTRSARRPPPDDPHPSARASPRPSQGAADVSPQPVNPGRSARPNSQPALTGFSSVRVSGGFPPQPLGARLRPPPANV